MLQDRDELNKFYKREDPWRFENNPEDKKRKLILLSEIPQREYGRTLDIGCGHGFITRDLLGKEVLGIDVSDDAIKQAKKFENERIHFKQMSIFDLSKEIGAFDLIIITGVLYPQYIGDSLPLIYLLIDDVLKTSGILITVHITDWYKGQFPYFKINEFIYDYRKYVHILEVYIK